MKRIYFKYLSIPVVLFVVSHLFFSCQTKRIAKKPVRILTSDTLSTNGSTRATAYMMSNKIITANGKTFVAWLDRVADIKIKSFNLQTNRWSETVLLGKGVDNHSGPAITMDSRGYLYAVFGPHHGPFQFRKSAKPYDISVWEPIENFGVNGTYPSLICDGNDMLHCTYRGGPMPRRLIYQQKPAGGEWSAPVEIVNPGVPDGYTQYGNPLTISPDGVIHLGFHIYDVHPDAGKSVGYLRSADSGKSWQNADGKKMTLPVTPDSPCFIEQGPELDMRAGSLVTDEKNNPWFTVFHNETKPRSVLIWHHDGRKWQAVSPNRIVKNRFPDRGLLYSSLTFDRHGYLYMVSVTQKIGVAKFWGDPSAEIILLASADHGKTFDMVPVSKPDANLPNWMPSIERPFGPHPIAGVPAFLYTHGGPGKDLTSGAGTEVIFVRLAK